MLDGVTEHVTDGVCDGVCDGVWLFGKDSFEECPLTAPINQDAGNVRVFEETPIEEQLNWGTDSAGDDQSDLDNEIAESAGLDTGMYVSYKSSLR